MNRNKSKRTWTQEEDQLIIDFVKQNGTKSWVATAAQLKAISYKRKASQCRDRWFNHLDPKIEKKEWAVAEQKTLFMSLQKYGSRWCQISKLLPGRTQNSIKNQFYSILRSCIKLLTKNFRPKIFSSIRQMSPLDLFNLYMRVQGDTTSKNIIKEMLFTLDFQIYKQTVLRFMEGKQARLKDFFDSIENDYEKKENHKSSRESTTNLTHSLSDSQAQKKMNSSCQVEQHSSKYMMVNVYLPVYVNKENKLKLGYENSLVELLNKQLQTLDINYFLQNQ